MLGRRGLATCSWASTVPAIYAATMSSETDDINVGEWRSRARTPTIAKNKTRAGEGERVEQEGGNKNWWVLAGEVQIERIIGRWRALCPIGRIEKHGNGRRLLEKDIYRWICQTNDSIIRVLFGASGSDYIRSDKLIAIIQFLKCHFPWKRRTFFIYRYELWDFWLGNERITPEGNPKRRSRGNVELNRTATKNSLLDKFGLLGSAARNGQWMSGGVFGSFTERGPSSHGNTQSIAGH